MQNKPFFFENTGSQKGGRGGGGAQPWGKIPKKSRFFFWERPLIRFEILESIVVDYNRIHFHLPLTHKHISSSFHLSSALVWKWLYSVFLINVYDRLHIYPRDRNIFTHFFSTWNTTFLQKMWNKSKKINKK